MRRTGKRQVTYQVGDEVYSGDTLTAAKEKAHAHAAELLSSNWAPWFLSWRGHELIMWRGKYCWEYRILFPDQREEGKVYGEGKQSVLWGNSSGESGREEQTAWDDAKRHLAQVTWDHADGSEETAVPDWVTNEEDRKELRSWMEWQIRYRAFREEGNSDLESHALASGWKLDAKGRAVPQSATVA